jgi:hypothetical protein
MRLDNSIGVTRGKKRGGGGHWRFRISGGVDDLGPVSNNDISAGSCLNEPFFLQLLHQRCVDEIACGGSGGFFAEGSQQLSDAFQVDVDGFLQKFLAVDAVGLGEDFWPSL